MDKRCQIVMTDSGITVKFKGLWNRREVDGAYKVMLKQLQVHMAELRKGGSYARTEREEGSNTERVGGEEGSTS